MKRSLISYSEAFQKVMGCISSLSSEYCKIPGVAGRVVSEDLFAKVDSPSVDGSLKDGYAVQSADVAAASYDNPVHLRLSGCIPAGGVWKGTVKPGTAVKILSGAKIPKGASAVVANEYASDDGQVVTVVNTAEEGRNILKLGSDIKTGELLVAKGRMLKPAAVGMLAAAGYTEVPLFKRPKVAIIATGDEVIAPGKQLLEGQLFASNIVTLAEWCNIFGMTCKTWVVRDDQELIRQRLQEVLREFDAVITSGGAWTGERDLIIRIMDDLGWDKKFHRVRMGPGKAIGFGLFQSIPVFCLPGGPPSNLMAFLQLALPGLLTMCGYKEPGLTVVPARLGEPVRGQKDWTQFIHGTFIDDNALPIFKPIQMTSRLQMLSRGEAIMAIPEGRDFIDAGEIIQVQKL
ncbi:gephyrin-like molybdotransferase Glp [Phosphitispora sp. TUW77]|uniref:molybdopterin molybdotransferase MoeA n=1 Tax=Phosphitispora sp. TUW77 TaxID=3152361 RepID=UPI003AB1B18E